MVSRMPNLLALDDFMVTDEERIEEVSFGKRFRALAPHMRIVVPDFLEGLSADQHLFHLDVEIYKLKRLHEKNSPSIRIQALFRGFRQRIANQRYFQKKMDSVVFIQKMTRAWLQRKEWKRQLIELMKENNMEDLLLTGPQMELHRALQKIRGPLRMFMLRRRILRRKRIAAEMIQKWFRGYRSRKLAMINGLQLQKYPYMYFLEE